MLFLNLRRSDRAAAFAAILNDHDSHCPFGIHEKVMLKQCRSYVALNCVVDILNAMISKFVDRFNDSAGVSFTFPDTPSVCVCLWFVISWLLEYWYDRL